MQSQKEICEVQEGQIDCSFSKYGLIFRTSVPVERILDAEPRRFSVLFAELEGNDHTGGSPSCVALTSHGRTIKTHNNACREKSERLSRRP